MTDTLATLRARLWSRLPVSLRIGGCILTFWIIVAASGPFWTPFAYDSIGAGIPLSPMSWDHPLGVDQLGRDVFSRIVHGAHIVMLLSLSSTILGFAVGAMVGLLSAYVGGWIDEVTQRLVEALISIPFIVLGLMAIASAGPELAGEPVLLVLVIALIYAPRVARIARAAALDVITRDFVTAARIRGEGAWSIMWRELLPNTSGVLLVEFSLRAGSAPVLIGSLGFLGFGMRPPTPEWGLMIAENRDLILTAPITVLAPGLALASLVVGLNMFTEGLARILGRTVQLADQ
jgi:peptide/nickel transport system permease protein